MGMIQGPHSAPIYSALRSASYMLSDMAWGMLPGAKAPAQAVGLTAATIGDGAVWFLDAGVLVDSLRLEGLGFLEDLVFRLDLKSDQPIAEAWDRRNQNMAKLHNQFSQAHTVGAMYPFDRLALWFARDDEMKGKLLEHYIWKQGSKRVMTHREVHAMVTYIDVFQTTHYAESMEGPIQDALAGKEVQVKTEILGANNALGNFPIDLEGTLRRSTGPPAGATATPYFPKLEFVDPGGPLVFEGQMVWRDHWDFDAKVADTLRKKSGRGPGGEAAVNLVAALVDGVPFDAVSVKLPVTQHSGRAPIY